MFFLLLRIHWFSLKFALQVWRKSAALCRFWNSSLMSLTFTEAKVSNVLCVSVKRCESLKICLVLWWGYRTICCQRSFKLWQRLWFAVIFKWDWDAKHFSNVRSESDLQNNRWKVFKWGRRKAAFQWQEPFALRTKVTLIISIYFVPLYIAGAVLDWYMCKICANKCHKISFKFLIALQELFALRTKVLLIIA